MRIIVDLAQEILEEVRELSSFQQQEVLHFIQFLKHKETITSQLPALFGSDKGKIHISEDFDAPLDDFQEYM
ncbi:MAG: hypothetical protein N5P05_004570 (plasmid) [Chroococcopsis gigantea SAG 12.99]|jgi:hypothetical protein|nr:hypothetical protein [Chroococcopsis gigantea SAG 12.99]MDV3002915.1 hypothetical protein [Chroococcopsis gigantea SAG 12.99]